MSTHKKRYIKVEEPYRINEKIKADQVRVVGEDITPDLYPIQVALQMAREKGLDLVEISSKADFPICKIIDYSKFKYQQKKKQKLIKAQTNKVIVKSVGFTPNTDEHDTDFKTRHAIKFLKEKAKLSIYVHFRGREFKFKEKGTKLLKAITEKLALYGKPLEKEPKMQGKRMILTFIPHTKKNINQDKNAQSKNQLSS